MLLDILDSKLSLLVGIQRYSQCLGAETRAGNRKAGSQDFLQKAGAEAAKKSVKGARAVKPYLVGAGAGVGKSPLRTSTRSRDPLPGSREPDVLRADTGKRNL